MKTVEAIQPHWYQALCDSDTPQSASRKRIRKSVDRTLQYADACIEQQHKLAVSIACIEERLCCKTLGFRNLLQAIRKSK